MFVIAASLLWNWTLRRRVADRTSELRRTFDNLQESQQHFEALVTTTPVGVFEADVDGAWLYVNARWLEISGLSHQQTLGYGWTEALHPDGRENVLNEWKNAVQENRCCSLEFRLHGMDRKERWVLGQASPIKDAEGRVSGFIGSATDITERKAAEAKIEFLAFHDPLTELPNRIVLKDHMQMAMAYADRADTKAALLLLDLDKFKAVNDSLGHPAGDALIQAVAQRLLKCVRNTDTVSRLGGDEFLILLFNMADVATVTKSLEKILERFAATFNIEGQELSTTISIGVAVYPDHGRDYDTLLKKADIAMYGAKEAGRNTYLFYTERMCTNTRESLYMRNCLRRALEHNEFTLHYQPQIDVASGRTIGAEALIRWRHPERGFISPGTFIPVAEDSGFIVEIGEWALREACRQGVAWRRAGLPELTMAVNLSAVQFKRSDLKHIVSQTLIQSGFDPALLELEMTESILIGDTEDVLDMVQQLKAIGVKLSIDDFGTGYCSLAYLRRFSLDKLKIDQSFIRNMATNPEDSAIVRTIIKLGHELNLKTIAEGIEDEHQLAFLRQEQCDEAQGYFIGRSMPPDEFAAHVTLRSMEPA